ncbi:MAG: ATP-binding cassette domain-containing protein, partial [Myxococcota bacterium]
MKTAYKLTGHGVTVKRGGTTILKSIDFVAQQGHLIGVLGPSGSGKSTLLMALSGFRPATGGRVVFDRKDLYDAFETLKTRIGFVPQDDIVPTQLRVERVIKYAAEL